MQNMLDKRDMYAVKKEGYSLWCKIKNIQQSIVMKNRKASQLIKFVRNDTESIKIFSYGEHSNLISFKNTKINHVLLDSFCRR